MGDSSPSIFFKDSIIYQQGKIMMRVDKFVPKIAQVKYSSSTQITEMANKYNIT
jgi:hypothetical protein